jgi:hypothetical protein
MLAVYIDLWECFAQLVSISLAKLVGWRESSGPQIQSTICSLAYVIR